MKEVIHATHSDSTQTKRRFGDKWLVTKFPQCKLAFMMETPIFMQLGQPQVDVGLMM